MKEEPNRRRNVTVVALAVCIALTSGVAATAQCVTTYNLPSYYMGTMTTLFGTIRAFPSGENCGSQMSMSVQVCLFSVGTLTMSMQTIFQATARKPTDVSPSCEFVCDCGTVSLTAALPVELMDFSIETKAEKPADDPPSIDD